jgi:hypothetical protein
MFGSFGSMIADGGPVPVDWLFHPFFPKSKNTIIEGLPTDA